MNGHILLIVLWFFGSVYSFPFSKNTQPCEVRRKRSLIHSDSSGDTQKSDEKLPQGSEEINPNDKNILARARSITKPKGYDEMVKRAAKLNEVPQTIEEIDERGSSGGVEGQGYTDDLDKRWDSRMYVMIDDELTKEEKDLTTAAIYTLKEAMKCFDFMIVPVGDLSPDVDHVHIKIHDPSIGKIICGTKLGRKGGKQIINIGRSCKDRFGVTMHETMHALGFFHEHTRKDRDEFIKIHWDQIPNGKERNYEIRDDQDQIDEYDFDSIMHYAFNKQVTPLEGKVPPGITVGQRNHLSVLDKKRLNQVYPC